MMKFGIKVFCVLTAGLILFAENSPAQQRRLLKQKQINDQLRIAQGYERRANYQRALGIYKKLYDQVPGNHIYYEGVKRNMLRIKQFDELLQIINSQIVRANDPRFYADAGNVYYQSKNLEKNSVEMEKIGHFYLS